jgi:hypothetical protein
MTTIGADLSKFAINAGLNRGGALTHMHVIFIGFDMGVWQGY